MNLTDLQFFKYTAKYKNITKAAKHFYVSQSTLSRNIMALESELGTKLFVRTNKNISLTPAGQQLYEDCDLLINHIETITAKVKEVSKTGKGTIRIALPTILDTSVHTTLKDFKKNYTDIDVLIEILKLSDLTPAILHNIYDVAFTYNFALDKNEEIEATPISIDNFSLIVPSDMYDCPTLDTVPQIVSQLPLILPNVIEPPFMKSLIHEIVQHSNINDIKKLYVNSTDSAILKTSLGLGFSIIPTSIFDLNVNSNYIKKIDLSGFNTTAKIIMIHRKNTSNEITKKFVEYIKQTFSESPKLT